MVPYKRIFMIDMENVQNGVLLDLPNTTTERDLICLFYSSANEKGLSFNHLQAINNVKAKVECIKLIEPGPNSLDFQIATYAGMLSHQYKSPIYYFITKDTGFNAIVNTLQSLGRKACRIPTMPAPLQITKQTQQKSLQSSTLPKTQDVKIINTIPNIKTVEQLIRMCMTLHKAWVLDTNLVGAHIGTGINIDNLKDVNTPAATYYTNLKSLEDTKLFLNITRGFAVSTGQYRGLFWLHSISKTEADLRENIRSFIFDSIFLNDRRRNEYIAQVLNNCNPKFLWNYTHNVIEFYHLRCLEKKTPSSNQTLRSLNILEFRDLIKTRFFFNNNFNNKQEPENEILKLVTSNFIKTITDVMWGKSDVTQDKLFKRVVEELRIRYISGSHQFSGTKGLSTIKENIKENFDGINFLINLSSVF